MGRRSIGKPPHFLLYCSHEGLSIPDAEHCRLSDLHGFQKPNDLRALNLMNRAAEVCMHAILFVRALELGSSITLELQEVMGEYSDIRLAYGESDEYSFVFHKATELYGTCLHRLQLLRSLLSQHWLRQACVRPGRRPAKLVSLVASLFSAAYARFWPNFLPDTPLQMTPSFDGRSICYPTTETLQDYLAWRQVDTHVNNQVRRCTRMTALQHAHCSKHAAVCCVCCGAKLTRALSVQYNTCYWALVHDGRTGAEAQQMLKVCSPLAAFYCTRYHLY